MSATDSDNSIDWLASDTEDSNSEHESERTHNQSAAPSTDTRWSCEASARGPLSSCVESWGRNAIELCKTQQGEKMKRRRSFAEEEGGLIISSQSEKGRLFTRKCIELQCYIQPLSSILNGLRSGRYRERLSSFQESVAMDRIQRILGVLQNPYLGEKYISIILKMEEMLKSWFPNVKPLHQLAATHTEEVVLSKKLKPSPVTATVVLSPVTISDTPIAAKPLRVTDLTPPGAYSASNLKWLHTSPICSPTVEQAQAAPRHVSSPRDLTQDSAVSSSTDSPANRDSVPRGPPPGKINAPCLERLLKSTESIISRKGTSSMMDNSWS
ncbi:circadian-associated transcriptional repressor [Corythoichthys intestinalis]|uniref:circadian-associated transcriptional repressor n=1 Tax=Corythoichthys intestinalis TaxID=161448 RepID=UPI0025A5A285|nr:circadian-associated transcriptional repressor [Corythoichthys intestinalis]XP_061812797.1 circadian-associated transcriptional repressor-like [Nerophis lumbriciformis]